MKRFLALPVLIVALAVASFASVTVTTPTNGATVQSPVKFVASGYSRHGINGMAIYVDSKEVYSTQAGSLNTSVVMTSGTHAVVVTATSDSGRVYSDSMTLQVKAATTPAALQITTTALANGTAGKAYSAALAASGGTSPYTWSMASGTLPAGLALSTSGAISGTPSASGISSFSVTVKDSESTAKSVTAALKLTIAVSTPVVTPVKVTTSSLSSATVGKTYSAALAATGGTSPYNWSVASGTLPKGLALSTTGAISGTPTASGASSFQVSVKDAAATPQSATATLTLTVAASAPVVTRLTLSSGTLTSGTVGTSYSDTLRATGGTLPYIWTVTSGTLPAGLTLSSAGTISGTPTTPAITSFSVGVKDTETTPQTGTATLQVTIVKGTGSVTPPLKLTTTALANGTAGSSYSATLAASGGTSPYIWSVTSGSLPAGLTLSSAGAISGTPTTAAITSFSVSVKDTETTPQTATGAIQVTIVKGTGSVTPPLKLTTTALANGTAGSSYSATLAASGGTSPYIWSVVSGSLPAGLTLSTSGAISGTPTAAATSSFSVSVKDTETSPQAATATLALTIATATGTGPSSANYTQIVNGQPWPLDFLPFCKGTGKECPWNNPLPDNATAMSNSSSMISGLMGGGGAMTGLPDMANGGTGSGDFAHPVYLAAATDPLVTLGSGCGSGAGTTGAQIHIPAKARPTTSSDAHMGVIQPNGDEYDFWSVPNPSSDWKTGDTVNCQDSGNYSNIATGSGSLPHSATSGAALAAGDLRVNEVENGLVPHAIFVVIQGSNGFVYPGQSNAAQGGSIPIGARIQLKYTDAQIDAMTGLAVWEKTLLHQLHDYGLYVLDTGGDGYITYKWESPTQYTSFGGTNPGIEWNNANHPSANWVPNGINWATDLQIVSACYAEGTC